jgi:TonB family protein
MACLQRRPTGSRSQSRRLDHLIYRLEAVPATEPAEQRARRESSQVPDSATGDNSGSVSTSRGSIRQGGFGDADTALAQQVRSRPSLSEVAKKTPVEIISKPTPTYTEEARKLHIEGEVLLEVVFEASGRLRVVRVVRGLGHGLDENAQRAAEQIRFKPAMKEGQPADSTATVHILFQLA